MKDNPIFPILLVNFIGTLGFSIVLPFLVVLVISFGGNELVYGFMGATYSFFQLIGAPILGNWSDRVGRRKVLLVSQVGTFVAWAIFIVALVVPNTEIFTFDRWGLEAVTLTIPLALLFFARALDGITGGNVSVANAYLADVSDDENRKKNFGLMSASGSIGFIIGPAMAGVLGATLLGYKLPVIVAMLISFVAIAVIWLGLKESKPQVYKKSLDPKKTRKILGQEIKECHTLPKPHSIWEIMKLPGVPLILVVYFLIFLAFNFFYVAFPIHAIQYLGWSMFKMGIFFSVLSGVMVLVQGPLLSAISKHVSEEILFVVGNVILSGGFYFFTNEGDVLMFTGAVFFALGNGLMWPSFLSMLSRVAGDEMQGAVQGFASSSGSLASIVGLIVGGFVYGFIGTSIFWIPAVLVLAIGVFFIPIINTMHDRNALQSTP
jgi:MFS family permease